MKEFHVTYIRDSDRTRVIFVVQAEDAVMAGWEADQRKPRGFRHAACRQHTAGEAIEIPMDGDNYGAEVVPPHWTPAAVR